MATPLPVIASTTFSVRRQPASGGPGCSSRTRDSLHSHHRMKAILPKAQINPQRRKLGQKHGERRSFGNGRMEAWLPQRAVPLVDDLVSGGIVSVGGIVRAHGNEAEELQGGLSFGRFGRFLLDKLRAVKRIPE